MKGLLFTYLLTYGGGFAALFNPFIGLLVYVCFAIIKPQSLWFWSVPSGNYSRIVAIALLLGWALNGFGSWKFGHARGVVAALLGFFGWSIISAAFARHQAVGWEFVENMSKVVLPFLVGATLIDSVDKLKKLAWTIMLSQGYVAYELNRSYYDGYNRIQQNGFGGMDNNCVAIAMVAGCGLAFFLALGESIRWRRWLALSASALMAHAVMFSFSRGGMLGLIVTGIVGFLLLPKHPKHIAIFALAAVLALRMAGPQVVARFSTAFAEAGERDSSAQSRVEMWGNCLDVMQAHPILGVGPDNFPLIAHEFGWSSRKEAHTLWLQIGAELGLIGLGFLLAFYAICMQRMWRICRTVSIVDPWLRDAARMVLASLVGFSVSAQFVSLEGLELPYYVTLIGTGVLRLNSGSSIMEGATRSSEWNYPWHATTGPAWSPSIAAGLNADLTSSSRSQPI